VQRLCRSRDCLFHCHRQRLLERCHREQKKIDCLDYLVYQLQQRYMRRKDYLNKMKAFFLAHLN